MTVDHASPVPAYEQLASALRARIAKGEWSHGPLPSVKALQDEYGVGRDTVLRAIDMLRAEGLPASPPKRVLGPAVILGLENGFFLFEG